MDSDDITPHWFGVSTFAKRRTFPATMGAPATSSKFIHQEDSVSVSPEKGSEALPFDRLTVLLELSLLVVADTNNDVFSFTKDLGKAVDHPLIAS